MGMTDIMKRHGKEGNDMKIIILSGGLGNQLYQYTFMRLIELGIKEKFIIDDSAFWGENVDHNGYEMEKVFGLKLNLLSNYFTEDVWSEMLRLRDLGTSIPQQLADNGINLTMMAEFKDHPAFNRNIIYMPPNAYSNDVLYAYANTKGNVYYHGYWVCPPFVEAIKGVLQNELVFRDMDSVLGLPEINKQYARRIKETDSVALHIRRGDFLQCGRALTPDKYARSVVSMEERYKGCTYFVFSDDIAWCEEHKQELGLNVVAGNVVYITGNTGNGFNYVDMQLMSMCKKMIISNSSFGQWAYFLNQSAGVEAIIADRM